MSKKILVVGAGPAGAALAYLLARRGVSVTLLEKHPDFTRAFRGEGVQPSGMDAFAQMGLSDEFAKLPQATIRTMELYQGGRLSARLENARLGFVGAFVSQPAMLEMLTRAAGRFPNFRLEMGVTVRELLHENGRVVGIRADTPGGPREYRADLIVGTDGRSSVIRKHGQFPELNLRQNFDILWLKVPMPDFWPNGSTVRMELGDGFFTGCIPASDGRLQIGLTIPKGSFKELRARGAEVWTEELINRCSPDLAGYLRQNRAALNKAVLLDVIVGRLTTWTAPGLLLLGDAAHPMSPIGGQGLNLALRDALVAANHLCPAAAGAGDLDAAARKVAEERLPEIAAAQEHQDRQGKLFLAPGVFGRLMMRALPWLARTGLIRVLMRKRMRALQHGVVPIRLTA
jgi:2-polyprenyl-6-methoxyphenol hydroxylase-like FAD-dependent oxidoreductase